MMISLNFLYEETNRYAGIYVYKGFNHHRIHSQEML